MSRQELERRYKVWCKYAAKEKAQSDTSSGLTINPGPLFRHISTTPLVLRTDQGGALPMLPLPTIVRDTAQRIDNNAAAVAAGGQFSGEEMLVLTVQELATALANLGAHSSDDTKGLHGLGLHLLPFTVGKWLAEIRLPDGIDAPVTTEDRLLAVLEKIHKTDRFRYVAVHKSYTGLSRTDTRRRNKAHELLQFREAGAPLMSVLGDDLDTIDLKGLRDPNVLGLYMCRKSMVQRIQENAERAMRNFNVFTPEAPLDHILAERLYEASQVYGGAGRNPIQKYAGKSETGPIIREIPGIVTRAREIVRERHGMMQVTTLLVRLVATLLRVEGQRDGSKERGMLHNLRHATAVKPSNDLMFFLNITRKESESNQQTFAPPVLSEFDLRENSSGASKPSWAKALLELERLTGHDTWQDMRGSSIVTMVGFPFQCTFVLENEPGEPFYYCPHRFVNRYDAIEHVKAVHQGEGLTEETIMRIAQVDDQLAGSKFGELMQPVNEIAKVRDLGLDEKDTEMLRRRPTLHADLHEMSKAIMQNTRLLERLEKDRKDAIKMFESLDRSTKEGTEAVKRQRQLFAARNRQITEVKKHMLSPATLMSLQATWNRAKARKAYVTKHMYKEFLQSNEQCLWLERTVGEEKRLYEEKVKALGGDPGAIPAGVPGGGIRVNKANIGGMIAQDLIEQSRYAEVIEDANLAMLAANREANFQRVVSQNDVDFGASNVLPIATPVLAAEGWEVEEGENASQLYDNKEPSLENNPPLEPKAVSTSQIPPSNPLKRSRPNDDSDKEKGIVALVAREGASSIGMEPGVVPKKVQVLLPIFPSFLQDVLKVELERIIRIRGLQGIEKHQAMEAAKQTLTKGFHPRIGEEVKTLKLKDALGAGEIRTLMDRFRENVSVRVLTDPRLIRHPNGVLMRRLCGCVALIDSVHQTFSDDQESLCSVLATGVCTLLQPKYHLSEAGIKVVVQALKCVLLERIKGGRDGHWKVVTLLVEALNANLRGFWNAAYLRRYHDICDPSHKTRHVDKFPEQTYAPLNQLPSVDSVIARIKKPRIADTSPLSVSPSESSTVFSKLRVDEVKTLRDQVVLALAGHNADLVRIVDSQGLDAKTWIERLVKGNANATDNPHAMCTWFRDKKATIQECTDDEKHQWLRETYCCICFELLGSAPFQGWCCLSGAPSLDAILDQALQDETDPIRYSARRDTLKQSLVNKIISQPHYPSFHFWHRHCKQAEDNRKIVENSMRVIRNGGTAKGVRFDECPMCRTQYPRDMATFPSMQKIAQRNERTTKLVSTLVASNALPDLAPVPDQDMASGTDIQETPDSDDEGGTTHEATVQGESLGQSFELVRTGLAYLGALFQKDTGCEASPAAMIPPSPALPLPERRITLYDELVRSQDDSSSKITELENVLETTQANGAVVNIGTENPLDIAQINDLMDEIRPFHDLAIMEMDEMTEGASTSASMDTDGLLRSLLNLEDNQLLENIEASALDREEPEADNTITVDANPTALEPIALDSPEASNTHENFGAKTMGGSGSCGKRQCMACPFLMPRSNHIGTRRLTTTIDCLTKNVVYASVCHTCQILHGINKATGSLREEIQLLQGMSTNRSTLLSRCSSGHVPTVVGLETFTTEEEALAKSKTWEDEFRKMKTLNLQAI